MSDIRVATRADFASLRTIFEDSIRVTAAARYDERQRRAWLGRTEPETWFEGFEALETLLAEDGDGPLGFASFSDQGYVDRLFTAPRAARRGVAGRLLDEAARRLRARGVVELTTHASLVARPVFERRGFEVVDEETVEVDGVPLERFAMRKRLTGD